jgi:hypothetical protein
MFFFFFEPPWLPGVAAALGQGHGRGQLRASFGT